MKVVKRMLQFLHSAIYNADHFRLTFSLSSIEEDVKSFSYQYTPPFGGVKSVLLKWKKGCLFHRRLPHSFYPLPICQVVKGQHSLHVILEDGSYRLVDFTLRCYGSTCKYQLREALKLQSELSPYHLKLSRIKLEITRLRGVMGVW